MSSLIFAKLDPGFFNNRKILRAGRNGRDVFLAVLCMNAGRGGPGWIPAGDFEPWYLAHVLGITPEEAQDGIEKAVAAGLVSRDVTRVTIVGWSEEWSRRAKTDAERAKEYRERKTQGGTQTSDDRHEPNVTPSRENHASRIRGEERRGERAERDALSPRGGIESGERARGTPAESGQGVPRRREAHALPDAWEPSSQLTNLASQLGLDLAHEIATFRAHHRSMGSTCVDWNARFEKWLRGSRDKGKAKTPRRQARHRQTLEDGTVLVENDRGELVPESGG